MTGAVPGGSGQSDPARIARDVRQVLALAGLPEASGGGLGGGYSVVTRDDGRVYVGWVTEGRLYNQAFVIEEVHPQCTRSRGGEGEHRLRLDRARVERGPER